MISQMVAIHKLNTRVPDQLLSWQLETGQSGFISNREERVILETSRQTVLVRLRTSFEPRGLMSLEESG